MATRPHSNNFSQDKRFNSKSYKNINATNTSNNGHTRNQTFKNYNPLSQNGQTSNGKNTYINQILSSSESSGDELEFNNGGVTVKSPTLERTEKILNNVLKSYGNLEASTKSKSSLTNSENKAIQLIKDSLNKSNDNSCLICISTVKNKHAIWSCPSCYNIFHLQCIQTWINDGAYKNAINPIISATFDIEIKWTCPKCRAEFDKTSTPKKYLCFCGKEENPSHEDPWLLPHSCGKICSKTLASCTHSCLMLCHPGPCPPCPKTIRSPCHCGTAQPVVRRCAAQTWSCGKVCRKKLDCGTHSCHLNCHAGLCPPCKKESVQPCDCGHNMEKRPCQSPSWKCNKICGKEFSCGYHECELICHEGECERYCPRSGTRTCPCGKQSFSDIPCYKDPPNCGQTCEKLMPCGLHKCQERCHVGPCGMCRQPTEKVCRCGQSKKTLPCNKEMICEIRCPKMRNCGVHICRRKCCDGKCNDCDLICGAQLNCRKHKCSSPCHRGPCYPCSMTIRIPCSCGKSVKTVPCGKEKKTRPPPCKEFCRKRPGCHHPKTEPHYCHFGDCPPCRMACAKILPCSHACRETCHSFVLVPKASLHEITVAGQVPNQPIRRNAPWEPKPSNELLHTKLNCPPCKVAVPVQCLGGHGAKEFECFAVQPYSCGDVCGRQLECGNHVCTITCHQTSSNKPNKGQNPNPTELESGVECETCFHPCSKSRPAGCPHDCNMPCHPGPCSPCNKMIRMKCLCGLNTVYVECERWRQFLEAKGSAGRKGDNGNILSCGNRCPNLLPDCGHRCPGVCHEPPCGSNDLKKCMTKVKIQCRCGNVKKVLLCNQVSIQEQSLNNNGCSTAFLDCQESCQETGRLKLDEKEPEVDIHPIEEPAEEFVKVRRPKKVRFEATSSDTTKAPKITGKIITVFIVMIFLIVAYFSFYLF